MTDLTDAELAFRALLRDPKAYAKWAEKVRARWTAEMGRAQLSSTPEGLRLLASSTRLARDGMPLA